MRFALAILVLALIVGGYSTAAHAFESINCEQSSTSKTENVEANCHDFQKLSSHDKQEKTDKSSKESCSDCHHCCAGSAVTVMNGGFIVPLYDDVLLSAAHDLRDGSFLSQLRRPPKSLV